MSLSDEDISSASLHGFNAAQARSIGIDYNLLQLIKEAKSDKDYQKVVEAFRGGCDIKQLPLSHPARPLGAVWHRISTFDNHDLLVLDGHRIIVPKSSRKDILTLLHKPHVGQTGTRKLAQQLYYWPSINNDIRILCESCEQCRKYLASQPKEPLHQTVPEYPRQMLSVDLFTESGNDYLVTVDRYSGMPWVDRLGKLSTSAIINKLKARFNDMGFLPQSIRADNGPQFRGEFSEWCDTLNIQLEHSAPYNSQSNGHAEAAVKNAKKLLGKCGGVYGEDFLGRFREWKNTPRADGYAPADLFYGRRQRGLLPVLPVAHDPIDHVDAELQRQATQDRSKANFDRKAKPIKDITVGSTVLVQNQRSQQWDITGKVLGLFQNGRCLKIQLPSGGIYFRNRRHAKLKSSKENTKK